jgi:hypothetical protein
MVTMYHLNESEIECRTTCVCILSKREWLQSYKRLDKHMSKVELKTSRSEQERVRPWVVQTFCTPNKFLHSRMSFHRFLRDNFWSLKNSVS